MRGMLAHPQAVQNENLDSRNLLHNIVWDVVAVGDVRKALAIFRRENIAAAGEAVLHPEGLDFYASDGERRGILHKLHLRAIKAADPPLRRNIRENTAHRRDRLGKRVALHDLANHAHCPAVCAGGGGIARNDLAVDGVEAADIVERGDVVHVSVRQKDGVHLLHGMLYARLTKLRRSIDEKRRIAGSDISAAAAALIAGVGGCADRAIAPDLRDSYRCPRSKKLER